MDNLEQDKNIIDNQNGGPFIIHLLMENKCNLPDKEQMLKVMQNHFTSIENTFHKDDSVGFCSKEYFINVNSNEEVKQLFPQLLIMGCTEIDSPIMNDLDETQIWNCENGREILNNCKYQVVATDIMASTLVARERADMLVRYIEALAEMFPECRAMVFENSKKMFTRDSIINCNVPNEQKFIYYAVNIRKFTIDGTEDKIVDTIGMSLLSLPDLQYHFHGVDSNSVVEHAYNVLLYIFNENNPINNGDTIDGLINGKMSMGVQWKVQYEESLIQPIREVIDINMGEYASGNR